MGIRVKRFPEYGLTLDIWSGPITSEEIIKHLEGLTPADANRRITFLDQTVDLSTTSITTIPELMRVAVGRLKDLYAGRPLLSAIVWGPDVNRPVLDFWQRYAWSDSEQAPDPAASLEEACDWLDLPQAAREAVAEAVRT